MYLLFTKCHFSCFLENEFSCMMQKVDVTKTNKSHDTNGTIDVTETNKSHDAMGTMDVTRTDKSHVVMEFMLVILG